MTTTGLSSSSANLDRSDPAASDPRAEPNRQRPVARLAALDGLRGVAAFVVVIYHIFLIATPYLEPANGQPVVPFSLWWWLTSTPLKLLVAGPEAVLVFFVLSGLVVSLPGMRHRDFSWPGFLAGRFVRLYLPAWGALLFATALLLVVPRTLAQVTGGAWIDTEAQKTFDPIELVNEMALVFGGHPYDNVLWTLQWEVMFSLLLPVFLVLAVALRKWWLPAGALALGLSVWGAILGSDPLEYLPVFFLGTLMAVRLTEVRDWSDRLPARRSRAIVTTVVVVSLLVLIASWLLQPVVPLGSVGNHALVAMASLGAAGLVGTAVGGTWWRRLLERRAPQFLGRISFSLYLVHVPIITTIAYLVGDWNWWVALAVGLPLALATAVLFHRFVETPMHRLARAANSAATRGMAALAAH